MRIKKLMLSIEHLLSARHCAGHLVPTVTPYCVPQCQIRVPLSLCLHSLFPSATGSKISFLLFLSNPGAGSEFIERAPISLGAGLSLYDATFLFSESEPKDLAGENLNQIGEHQHSSSPPPLTAHLCHGVREIGSPGEQLQSPFQSQFPAELCVTLLATFQK